MSFGFLNRVQGKVKVAQLWLASGLNNIANGIYDAKSGLRVALGGGARLAMTVTAAATTDFTMSIPPGASIASMEVFTTTAFGAVTDAKISIGTSAGDQTYVAQTSIKAGGVVTLAPAATTACAAALLALPAGSPNLWVRITQSGGNSATGAATLVIDYDLA